MVEDEDDVERDVSMVAIRRRRLVELLLLCAGVAGVLSDVAVAGGCWGVCVWACASITCTLFMFSVWLDMDATPC